MPRSRRRPGAARLLAAALTLLFVCRPVAAAPQSVTDSGLAPAKGDPDWHIPLPPPRSASANPADGRAAGQRAALSEALERYRALANEGGWPVLDAGPELAIGSRDTRVPALRRRLQLTGDYVGPMQADPLFFDTAMALAVGRYQARHGLPATGRLDDRSRESMNRPVTEKIAQLIASLQRWQWLPTAFESRYLWVNTAAATLQLLEDGRERLAMRIVVGHPSRPTPSLRSEISHIVLNPSWSVPDRIARHDLLPMEQSNPGFLSSQHYSVYDSWHRDAPAIDPGSVDWQGLHPGRFPYRLVQAPGPWNSLGRIKLMMPNEHDIYLHDTNAAYLFGLTARSFSSGCVRLADAPGLSRALLAANDGEDGSSLARGLEQGATRSMELDKPVPVYLVYLTAWADDSGDVHFRHDVYGRDRRLSSAIDASTQAFDMQTDKIGPPGYVAEKR